MSIEAIMAAVAEERVRQDEQWGGAANDQKHGPQTWLAILGRQVGHVCEQDLVDATEDQRNLRAELVQVAAVCAAWAEALGVAPAAWAERVAHLANREPQTTPLANLLTEVGWMAMDATLANPSVGALVHGLAHIAATAVAWAVALEPVKEGRSDG